MIPTESSSGATASSSPVLSRTSASNLLAQVAGGAGDALSFGTNVQVACLTGPASVNVSTGEYDISGVELGPSNAPGYARIAVNRASGFDAPTGAAPVRVASKAMALTPVASADWAGINAVALVRGSGAVVAWRPLDTPVYVRAGEVARIPVGMLFFYCASA